MTDFCQFSANPPMPTRDGFFVSVATPGESPAVRFSPFTTDAARARDWFAAAISAPAVTAAALFRTATAAGEIAIARYKCDGVDGGRANRWTNELEQARQRGRDEAAAELERHAEPALTPNLLRNASRARLVAANAAVATAERDGAGLVAARLEQRRAIEAHLGEHVGPSDICMQCRVELTDESTGAQLCASCHAGGPFPGAELERESIPLADVADRATMTDRADRHLCYARGNIARAMAFVEGAEALNADKLATWRAGRDAAKGGMTARANPHFGRGTAAEMIWLDGHAEGQELLHSDAQARRDGYARNIFESGEADR